MELHQQLSLVIAASDLLYVSGSILNSADHLRSWPFTQWGAMVSFETCKTLHEVHGVDVKFDWEDDVAAAARHGGKFFDGRSSQLDSVIADFRSLAEATHTAFYPSDRRGRAFDFLRNDLAVFTDGDELVLTNVTGHFMVGLSPDRGLEMESWGPHVLALTTGIGQLAATLAAGTLEQFQEHGSRTPADLQSWDANISTLVPAAFGGELENSLALAVISIYSTVQAARRWGHAECCAWCETASLKHRFVVLHHAVRSVQQLAPRAEGIGPIATRHVSAILEAKGVLAVTTPPFRRLRNGWFHLGLGDIASKLPPEPTLLTPVSAYTDMAPAEFEKLVDASLSSVASEIGAWIAERGTDGSSWFDHLQVPRA
jgi:hypothetical protein